MSSATNPTHTVITPAEFLAKATLAAREGGHLFPQYAACEAALESAWGRSALAVQASNLFGEKQSHPPLGKTLQLPTREFLHGAWLQVQASWAIYDSWADCFSARMALLKRLQGEYPNYRAALSATDGEQFIEHVSRSWSTDPARAEKVLGVYAEHFATGAALLVST